MMLRTFLAAPVLRRTHSAYLLTPFFHNPSTIQRPSPFSPLLLPHTTLPFTFARRRNVGAVRPSCRSGPKKVKNTATDFPMINAHGVMLGGSKRIKGMMITMEASSTSLSPSNSHCNSHTQIQPQTHRCTVKTRPKDKLCSRREKQIEPS